MVYIMNIVVFGLGAIGTVFACSLKTSGHHVYGITKESYLKELAGKPLKIKGIFGNKEANLDGIFTGCDALKDKRIDLVVLSVKSFDTAKAIEDIKRIVCENTIVVLAQNGYGNYEIAIKALGNEHVVLSRVIFGAKLLERNVAEVTVIADDVVIGQPDSAIPDDKLIELASLFSNAGIPTRFSKEVYSLLWDKILYNCALNPLGAILECNYGKLTELNVTKAVINQIIFEIFKVANKSNLPLNWDSPQKYLDHFYNNLLPPTKNHYPSMYYDIKSGKKTEIDALNGAIVNMGRQYNVFTPTNEVITNLVKAKETLAKYGNF